MKFNPRSLLGLTLESANKKAKEFGFYIVETSDNADTIFFAMNYEPNRINVRISHDIVVEYVGNG